VGTSLHHALCHLLGGLFDAPHAETHAIVLPYVVSYLRPAVPEAARRLAQAMGTSEHALARSIWDLGRSVGTPAGLRSVGIREEQIPLLTQAALDKQLPSPRPLGYGPLNEVLHAAWTGQPPLA
jgi:maleylacetate reductase